ncbi:MULTISPECIES: ABC transporter permease subunit [Thalassospira]|uniref:Peptide ABC transporter permease n=3 Tax=Thalassospira lucentensis TaxID=168935 RepID=A0A358HRQ5_9PROT|nr:MULTISPECIES: ABC transporter permease subunit [Thalassospira]HBU97869.1 peptide ABC transporter permease [Thalassospira lucentensis]|tara:strand:- start:553 stop:1563 length:1011 start_codon:yes stop_codon:yes gene_type:complete
MLGFLLRRLGDVIPTFFGVTILVFLMIHLIPSDPIQMMAGERGVDPARYAELQKEYGFDKPLVVQYFNYLGGVLQGDLGKSFVTKRPVIEEFATLFPATIELSVMGILFAVIIGLPLGVIAAINRGKWLDHLTMSLSLTGYSMPIFWWALLLIMFFSTSLGWTPVSGRLSVLYYIEPTTGFMLIDTLLSGEKGAFTSALSHLILPTIALGTIPMAVIARMTRSSMLEVLGEEYIRVARAKGLTPMRVIMVHALRNALIPVITVIGLQVGVLFAGAILTETIFSWPGIGKWIVEALNRRDYPTIQGGILMIAFVVMGVNLFVDLMYGVINPRIRHKR